MPSRFIHRVADVSSAADAFLIDQFGTLHDGTASSQLAACLGIPALTKLATEYGKRGSNVRFFGKPHQSVYRGAFAALPDIKI